ncbi:MAG: HD domain-containing protein [Planctomycetes bacterium]|jgi:5'-deoxynucleotidase YfbR-like HD superfamily hydrolase|nr:HD domain-containing protein [Planctomycetota bacterium]
MVKKLPGKYQKLVKECRVYFKECREGDGEHGLEVAQIIHNYSGKIKINKNILIPVALMHDIGHSVILSEHFKYITGEEKIANGKLVHMLAGAKIAKNILEKLKYPTKEIKEIVEIISIHDFDQLNGVDWKKNYNTINKRFFHDVDSLDRYNLRRLSKLGGFYKNKKTLLKVLENFLNFFFFTEFKKIASNNLRAMKDFFNAK